MPRKMYVVVRHLDAGESHTVSDFLTLGRAFEVRSQLERRDPANTYRVHERAPGGTSNAFGEVVAEEKRPGGSYTPG